MTAETISSRDTSDRQQLVLVAGCFLLSGFAALLYETVWLRQFSINFGTSEQALAIVLGTYMGGLALGSLIASRVVVHLRRPLLTYGLLELGIAISALLVPVALSLVRYLQVTLYGGTEQPPAAGEPSQILFSFLGAFAATILPTTMMGATLPMLAKHVVHHDDQLGKRIGALYAVNTLGAVLGTLTCAFVCLPRLGLLHTTLIGASINVLVFLIVWVMFRSQAKAAEVVGTASREVSPSRAPGKPSQRSNASDESSRDWILWLIACSGAVSFAYEIIFTRMIGHFLGGTIFAFASMLAAFLLGISIGGGIASRLARRRESSAIGFFYAQCATMLLAMLSWHLIEHLAGQINSLAAVESSESIPRVVCAILILLPPAISIGMTFPWAIRIHARDERDAASSSARVYAWNVVGGVVGAVVTGTYLLPALNYQLAITVAMVANLCIALFVFLLARPKYTHLATPIAAVALLAIAFPRQPEELLRVSSYENYVVPGELVFVSTGRSGTVTTHNIAGNYLFSTNGLPEAGANPKGSFVQADTAPPWLGVLPALLRPDIDSMLVVGFGGGVTPAHAPRSIRDVDVFELEEGMIEANRLVSRERERDPITDPRINIILNDGRGGLALTSKKYDAIVSQPSHPWTAGASHLYTREFAQSVYEHLTDEGVFIWWIDLQFVNESTFRSLGATLADVFPHVSLFRPDYSTLLFVGSRASLEFAADPKQPTRASDRSLYQQMAADAPGTLLATLGLDDASMRELCKGARITTDNYNVLAVNLVESDGISEAGLELTDLINRYDPLLQQEQSDHFFNERVDRTFIMRRRLAMGRIRNAALMVEQIPDPSKRWFAKGIAFRAEGKLQESAEAYRKSVEADPANQQAWIFRFLMSSSDGVDPALQVDYATVKEHVSLPYSAIADAVELKRRGRNDNMASIDKALATIPRTDPLYGPAALIRIQWRASDESSGTMPERGREMLELIDRALPFTDKDDLLMYRLRAAVFANRPFIALSSAQDVANRISDAISERQAAATGQPELAGMPGAAGFSGAAGVSGLLGGMRIQLINCLTAIQSFEGDRRVPAHRYYGVRLYIQTQLEALGGW